jgi:hypothetical protein
VLQPSDAAKVQTVAVEHLLVERLRRDVVVEPQSKRGDVLDQNADRFRLVVAFGEPLGEAVEVATKRSAAMTGQCKRGEDVVGQHDASLR